MNATAILSFITALMQFAPEIPELIAAFETIKELVASGAPPTAEQQASIDAALDAAHAKVQSLAM